MQLEATIRATPCDVVVSATPVDLARLVDVDQPVRRVTYELREVGSPTLRNTLRPHVANWLDAARRS